MFSFRSREAEVKNNNIGMIVGRDTVFKGDVNVQGLIRIDGIFEGDIKTIGELVIGESGNIKGTVTALDATIAGTFNGDLTVAGKLELLGTARVIGIIKIGSLVTSDGAVFQGTCSMPGKDDDLFPNRTTSIENKTEIKKNE